MLANAVLRIAWVIAVAAAGAGLTRGLWQLWSAASWAVMSLVAAGPVCLLVEGLGWLPLIALLAVVPLLWVGATGGAFARPRAPGGD